MLQKSGQVGPFGGQKTIKLPKVDLEDVVTIYNGELKELNIVIENWRHMRNHLP